jgi:hypothetical protein
LQQDINHIYGYHSTDDEKMGKKEKVAEVSSVDEIFM